jgi:hypothetical protein
MEGLSVLNYISAACSLQKFSKETLQNTYEENSYVLNKRNIL